MVAQLAEPLFAAAHDDGGWGEKIGGVVPNAATPLSRSGGSVERRTIPKWIGRLLRLVKKGGSRRGEFLMRRRGLTRHRWVSPACSIQRPPLPSPLLQRRRGGRLNAHWKARTHTTLRACRASPPPSARYRAGGGMGRGASLEIHHLLPMRPSKTIEKMSLPDNALWSNSTECPKGINFNP